MKSELSTALDRLRCSLGISRDKCRKLPDYDTTYMPRCEAIKLNLALIEGAIKKTSDDLPPDHGLAGLRSLMSHVAAVERAIRELNQAIEGRDHTDPPSRQVNLEELARTARESGLLINQPLLGEHAEGWRDMEVPSVPSLRPEVGRRNTISSDGKSSGPKSPVLNRHTDVSFPEEVPALRPCAMRVQFVPAEEPLSDGSVRIIPKPHEHDATVLLEVPKPLTPTLPPPPIRVNAHVFAESFDIDGSARVEIIIPIVGKSAPVYFTLRGLRVGSGRIIIDFDQSGRHVGSVELRPRIIAGIPVSGTQARAEGEVSPTTHPGDPPDAVIKVFEFRLADEPGRLHFVFSSSDPHLMDLPVAMDGDLGTVDLRSDNAAWVECQLDRIGEVARRSDATPDDVRRRLRSVGQNLFDQLLPPN